jgi:hypothetical protein
MSANLKNTIPQIKTDPSPKLDRKPNNDFVEPGCRLSRYNRQPPCDAPTGKRHDILEFHY